MNYEQKYNEALERASKICNSDFEPNDKSILCSIIFPELKESEDERMREMAIKAVHAPEAQSCIKSWGINPDDVIAWLEKQDANKEYVFRPVAGTMIENAVEQALKQGDVVLAFNGFYTSVKGKTSDEILTEYDHWLEKQGKAESNDEDEKIRKELTEFLKGASGGFLNSAIQCETFGEWLEWLEKQGRQKQTWEPTAAQLIVIKDLIEDKNTSKVNKVILRGMLDEFTNNPKREIDDSYLQGICDARHEIEKQGE